MVSDRDIEKLKAIDYEVVFQDGDWDLKVDGQWKFYRWATQEEGLVAAKAMVQSPEGLKATMADKVRFIGSFWLEATESDGWFALRDTSQGLDNAARGDSPEAAVDALFWKVP